MPNPPLSREVAEETIRAVEACFADGFRPLGISGGPSGISEAARRLGLDDGTLRCRLRAAKRVYALEPDPARYVSPPIEAPPEMPVPKIARRKHKRRGAPEILIPSERELYIPDAHVPYEDPVAMEAMLRFVPIFKPHRLFILGDFNDFYQVSRFQVDPMRMFTLRADLDQGRRWLVRIRDAAPDAEIVYLEGNHEHRLVKYLWRVAPQIAVLRGISVPEQLGLEELRIRYVPGGIVDTPVGVVKHGNQTNRFGGYSARNELSKNIATGVSGHTHRLGHHYRRSRSMGMLDWMECGCLCQLDAEYGEGQTLDWQHGLGYSYVRGDTAARHLLPIENGRILWG